MFSLACCCCVLLVQLRVPRVGSGPFGRFQFVSMGRGCGTRSSFLGRCRSSRASSSRLIGRRRRFGCHYACSAEFPRFCGGRDRRLALIHRLVELVVRAGGLNMLGLHGGSPRHVSHLWPSLPPRSGEQRFRPRLRCSSRFHRDVIDDHGFGVDVGHVRNVVHGSVVEEGSVFQYPP